MNPFTLPAFAKINWQLKIIGKRDDGFHDIFTVFQTISLHDNLTFSNFETLQLTCSNENIPTDNSNLIIKAAEILQNRFSIKQGAKIHLEKMIPSPGGLGGGSSDCAVALLGLAKLWNIEVDVSELSKIGSELGSDVLFFFHGGTAIGSGRGNDISSIKDINQKYMVVVTPNEQVSTKEAYQRVDSSYLTKAHSKRILELCQSEAKKYQKKQFVLYNDFEDSVLNLYPEILRVSSSLIASGANSVLLSGSGASVFGVYSNLETQQNALKCFSGESDWKIFAVETISHSKYSKLLKIR
jgi:4-diphosphocytidyl-2-C-methyl-D-erythritol kinase